LDHGDDDNNMDVPLQIVQNSNNPNNNPNNINNININKLNLNTNYTNTVNQQTKNKETKKEIEIPEGFMQHSVQLKDTLTGIALRYCTTKENVKRINNLYSDNDLYKKKLIMVPDPSYTASPTPPLSLSPSSVSSSQKIKQVNKLAYMENISKEEAMFYLSDNNWDMNQARSSFNEDVAWAAEEWKRLHGNGKFKEWLGDSDVQTVAVVACGALIVLICVLL